jgi:hypothetical protein
MISAIFKNTVKRQVEKQIKKQISSSLQDFRGFISKEFAKNAPDLSEFQLFVREEMSKQQVIPKDHFDAQIYATIHQKIEEAVGNLGEITATSLEKSTVINGLKAKMDRLESEVNNLF